MAHFAKLSEDNVVLSVEVVADADTINDQNIEDEATGIAFLQGIHGWLNWKKCSYNTKGGKYYNGDGTLADNQTKAFRKNYPGIGYTYNASLDMFLPPKPEGLNSWVIDEDVGNWKAPISYPTTETYGENISLSITWDEVNERWIATDNQDPQQSYRWDSENLSWIIL